MGFWKGSNKHGAKPTFDVVSLLDNGVWKRQEYIWTKVKSQDYRIAKWSNHSYLWDYNMNIEISDGIGESKSVLQIYDLSSMWYWV